MLLQALIEVPMRLDGTLFFSYLLSHGDCNIPRTITVIADAAELLAHQTIRTAIDDFFEFGSDRIQTMEDALRHQPTRLRRVALKPVEFIRRTFRFGARDIFHGVGRAMPVTRAAQNTAATALSEAFGVKPFFDPFEPHRFI
jgi:hypothetical protein